MMNFQCRIFVLPILALAPFSGTGADYEEKASNAIEDLELALAGNWTSITFGRHHDGGDFPGESPFISITRLPDQRILLSECKSGWTWQSWHSPLRFITTEELEEIKAQVLRFGRKAAKETVAYQNWRASLPDDGPQSLHPPEKFTIKIMIRGEKSVTISPQITEKKTQKEALEYIKSLIGRSDSKANPSKD